MRGQKNFYAYQLVEIAKVIILKTSSLQQIQYNCHKISSDILYITRKIKTKIHIETQTTTNNQNNTGDIIVLGLKLCYRAIGTKIAQY